MWFELSSIWIRTAFLPIWSQMMNLTVSVTMPQALRSCLSSGSDRRTKRYISKSFAKAVELEEVCDKCSLLPVGNLFNQDRREAKCQEHVR